MVSADSVRRGLKSRCHALPLRWLLRLRGPFSMHDDDIPCNPSRTPHFGEVCDKRRALLKGAAAGGALALTGLPLAGCSGLQTQAATGTRPASPAFKSV